MANVKISALPSYTGSAADLRWFVMNNSGNTETFKFSGYTSPFILTGNNASTIYSRTSTPTYIKDNTGNNLVWPGESLRLDDYCSGNTILGTNHYFRTDNNVGDAITNTTIIGNEIFVRRANNIFIQGQNHTYDRGGITGGYMLGGAGNTIQNTYGNASGIIGGQGNQATNYQFQNSTIIGGASNSLIGDVQNTSIFGSQSSQVGNTSYGAAVFGGASNVINGGGGAHIVGGYANTVNTTNVSGIYASRSCSMTNAYEDIGASIWGSWNSTITAGSPVAQIIGGNYNTISSVSPYAVILGGETNLLDNSPYSQILGGSGNTINCELPALERYNTIIGGTNNTIFDTGDEQKYQTIINSVDTTLSNGVDRVTAIGLSGRTINDAGSGTTYVENLKAFRQITSGFYDNGSIPQAGYTINLNNGDKQQITITGSAGNTALYFTGNLAGGRLVLKVINTSTGDLGFADNAPYDWKIPAVYPAASPSATDVYIFESFGDQALWFASQSKNLS